MAKRIEFIFDPFKLTGLSTPKKHKRAIMRDVGDFVVESVLDSVSSARSPVQGQSWKKSLSKSYKAFKKAAGAGSTADMELEGDMLNSLEAPIRKGKLALGVSDAQSPKADNHNKFTAKSKRTKVPQRRFIPAKGETFKQPIITGIKRIIKSYEE